VCWVRLTARQLLPERSTDTCAQPTPGRSRLHGQVPVSHTRPTRPSPAPLAHAQHATHLQARDAQQRQVNRLPLQAVLVCALDAIEHLALALVRAVARVRVQGGVVNTVPASCAYTRARVCGAARPVCVEQQKTRTCATRGALAAAPCHPMPNRSAPDPPATTTTTTTTHCLRAFATRTLM
jgi:hypothetical protein